MTIDIEILVPVDSKHPAHDDIFKTLNLLSLDLADSETLYIIVEGCAKFEPIEDLQSGAQYFYEEHTCPINFLPVELVAVDGDHDPHGLFTFVRAAWMTIDYLDEKTSEDYLRRFFPEIYKTGTTAGTVIGKNSK